MKTFDQIVQEVITLEPEETPEVVYAARWAWKHKTNKSDGLYEWYFFDTPTSTIPFMVVEWDMDRKGYAARGTNVRAPYTFDEINNIQTSPQTHVNWKAWTMTRDEFNGWLLQHVM